MPGDRLLVHCIPAEEVVEVLQTIPGETEALVEARWEERGEAPEEQAAMVRPIREVAVAAVVDHLKPQVLWGQVVMVVQASS